MNPTCIGEGVARIGARVRVRYADEDVDDEFELVSPEVDAAPERLSCESPLGRSLLGVQAGARVRFRAPGGIYSVTVVSVR